MKTDVSPDGLRLRVQIDQELNAEQTDALLRRIALARARMTPTVPRTTEASDATTVLVENMPALSISARAGGGFRLWLRHSGYNWIAYQIDDRAAAGLSHFVRKHIGAGPAGDLINDEPVGRH